jgi:hypothetical protein
MYIVNMDRQTSIAHRLNYWKQQRNIIKAHQAKAALVPLRKDWLEKQQKTITKMNTIELELF